MADRPARPHPDPAYPDPARPDPARPDPARRAGAGAGGGALIALGAIGGAAAGFVTREPTVGVLVGTALGIAAALAIWLSGRRG